MPITTCTKCGDAYEASSEESANESGRLCYGCWAADQHSQALSNWSGMYGDRMKPNPNHTPASPPAR